MLQPILEAFGLPAATCSVQQLHSGLINHTWKVVAGDKAYVLQQINTQVFHSPQDISDNVMKLRKFLNERVPDYLFVAPLAALSGQHLVRSNTGDCYRLMPFVAGSHTIDTAGTRAEALEAARQFGRFTHLLAGFNIGELRYTLPDFHNLTLRFRQFTQAHQQASPERLQEAGPAIQSAFRHQHLVQTYRSIKENSNIPLRVIHHDTKISNVLFDDNNQGLCVIDLDTVMPGYFISDLGDMMRTYLSPANEEEQDLSKVMVREDYFSAILEGYFSEMGGVLTDAEKKHCLYAGKYMMYMQAIRFLTDYLNDDVYYGASYPEHNLKRAQNQFTLLDRYFEAEERLDQIARGFTEK